MLKARFLGTPQISFGAASEGIFLTGRVQALFTYLCVTRQPQDRNKLADMLWDNQGDQQARGNLRYIIRDLRKVIGDYLVVENQTVAFNVDLPHWFDITSFTSYLAPNMRSPAAHLEPGILQELLNLYAGDFLAGFYMEEAASFEQWMLAQRSHFHDIMIYGLQLAAQQHLDMRAYEAGLALNQFLLTLEPWREEAHRQRMILLAASGQRSAALMQYELCCQILEKELDVAPMNETTSLYLQIKSGRWFVEQKAAASFNDKRVAIRAYPQVPFSEDAATSNPTEAAKSVAPEAQIDLGAMPTVGELIGRQQELCALQRWLNGDSGRLAAILGLGGQGKSALAAWFVQEQIRKIEGKRLPAKDQVTQIIWRSLAQKPSCVELLQDLIRRLTNKPQAVMSANFDQLITTLFTALQQNHCLIVLDGVEAVLANNAHEQPAEAERYEQLFRLWIERQHRSYLLLTSRLHSAALARMQQQKKLVHCLALAGLPAEQSAEFLKALGLDADPVHYQQLHQWYAGNPQLLSQAANLIHELFDGDVAAFLQEDLRFLGDIGATLAQQISRLLPLQQQMLQVLAEAQQPLSRQALRERLPANPDKEAYYDALRDLQRASLVQQASDQLQVATLPAAFLAEHIDVTVG